MPNDQQINMQNQSMQNHNHLHATMHHPQQQQQQAPHRNSGNYEHHPQQSYISGDDYAPYDNRSNYATDPYGPIPKPKRRLDLIGKVHF